MYFCTKSNDIVSNAVAQAALNGHLELLKWVRATEPPCPWGCDACDMAARGGQLEVLQWLHAQECPRRMVTTTVDIVADDNIIIMSLYRSQNTRISGIWETPVFHDLLRSLPLRFLYIHHLPVSNRCPWNWTTCSAAAAGGHLGVLEWARSQEPPCPWNGRTCSEAAMGGHLEV